MIRIVLPLLMFITLAQQCHAEEPLVPTKKELLGMCGFDKEVLKSPERAKLAAKYDGKLVKITGVAYHSGTVAAGITSQFFRFQLDHPTANPHPHNEMVIRFLDGTKDIQEKIREKTDVTTRMSITLYGKIRVPKTGGVVLEDATPVNPSAKK